MTTLSLAMIVRDAEPTLARALESVIGLCDELIVVDTGSLDRSKQIAAQMGARVFDFAWIDDFSAARNCSFQHCTGDWILWLDADDVISEPSRQKLLEVKNASLSDVIDIIYLPYQCAFSAKNRCELTVYRERLLRRLSAPKWNYPIHECIQVSTDRSLSFHEIFIEHRPSKEQRANREPARNLKIIEKALARGERSQRMLFYYGNELYDHDRLEEAVTAYRQFLQSEGRIWERYWAMRNVSRCYSAMGQYDSALEWGLLAIKEEPARAEAFYDVGMIYYGQDRPSEAIPYFLAATKLEKPQTSLVEDCYYGWLPYDCLSSCYLAVADYEKALENGLKALQDNPDNERLQENLQFLTKLAESVR